MSRSHTSFKNGKVALIFFIISFALSFISRSIFIKTLGADLLGLNTLLIGIIGYLNLAEMGIGPAISYALYKPLKEKKNEKIKEIITLQRWLYRRVAIIIIVASCILLPFFPVIFKDSNVPLLYVYLAFMVLLFSNLLGYFYNYRQIIFTADMKQYVLTKNVQGLTILKVISQIIMVFIMPYPYLWWVVIEFMFSLIITCNISIIVRKYYPWLTYSNVSVIKLRKKYNDIISNMKNIFIHHISTIITEKTDNIIIFSIATLAIVTKYNNYVTISLGVITLVSVMFSGIRDAIGNLISEGNTEKNVMFFFEFTSVKFFFSSIICTLLYFVYDDFIVLWVGEEFVVSNIVKLGIIVNLFISIARSTDFFLAGYGLFRDVWAVILEVVLCIVFAMVLGDFYGVPGVVWGFFMGKFPIIYIWKPYFLFKAGFKSSVIDFFTRHIFYMGLMVLPCILVYMFSHCITDIFLINKYITFIAHIVLYLLIVLVSSFFAYFLFLKEFKRASNRIFDILVKKF